MKTLGINFGHDASIAVLGEDGQIIMAVGEERINRIKSFTGWPKNALEAVASDCYRVAISGSSQAWTNSSKTYSRLIFGDIKDYYDIFNERPRRYSFLPKGSIDSCDLVLTRLEKLGIIPASITYHDHHLCHASSAYYTSGFNDALVVTADGQGDGRSATAHTVIDGVWTEIFSTSLPTSPGHMYSWITKLLGYKVSRHEGKITGLAAYGSANKMSHLRGKLLQYDHGADALISPYLFHESSNELTARLLCLLSAKPYYNSYEKLKRCLLDEIATDYLPEDLAALAQSELETAVVSWVRSLVDRTGLSNVALAGGTFANVKLNQRVASLSGVDALWIFPDMGDGGLSVGAAYLDFAQRSNFKSFALKDVYLGPQYTDKEILKAAENAGRTALKVDDLPSEIASCISKGKIVGLFQGRMEFGPRSLGNRSILLHPGHAEMNAIVNRRLNRTEFMPFAPSVLEEYADEIFVSRCKSSRSDHFMTITYDVSPQWLERLAGVVHVDSTARPQIVSSADNALYWSIIDHFRLLTGIPAVANTSFNMHEEPIVCSPADAIRAYSSGSVDCLFVGSYLIG